MLLPLHKDSIFLLQGRIFFIKNQKQCQLQNTITQLFLCGYWRAGKSDKLQSLQGTENSSYSTNSSCFSSRWLQGRKICSLNGSNCYVNYYVFIIQCRPWLHRQPLQATEQFPTGHVLPSPPLHQHSRLCSHTASWVSLLRTNPEKNQSHKQLSALLRHDPVPAAVE